MIQKLAIIERDLAIDVGLRAALDEQLASHPKVDGEETLVQRDLDELAAARDGLNFAGRSVSSQGWSDCRASHAET
ncbi:MAG: hypothetical protein WDO18_10065 [Acidobacteriota bacterium]